MAERRSPYLILGLPFGSSKETASRAFARATRRVRRHEAPPFDLEDVNWALHQVEQRGDDPSLSVDDFRLPADSSVYEVPTGTGILNPPVRALARRTAATTPEMLDRLRVDFIREIAAQVGNELRQKPLPRIHTFNEKGK